MLTILYGTDAYRLKETTDQVAKTAVERIDMADADAAEQVEGLLKYPSFFGEVRTAIVTNALTSDALAKLATQYDVGTLTDIHLIAVHRLDKKILADQKKVLAKLEKLGKVTEVAPLEGAALTKWVGEVAKAHGRSITPDAATLLVQYAGPDSWTLANELEKLCAYSPTTIDRDAVVALVPAPVTEDQWALSNAIAAHDKRAAVTALYQKVHQGTPEPLLLGTLAGAIRTLMMVGDLAAKGQPAGVIAKNTGLHPFVVSKNLAGARAYPADTLGNTHAALAQLDRHSKVGLADATDGLFSILLAL